MPTLTQGGISELKTDGKTEGKGRKNKRRDGGREGERERGRNKRMKQEGIGDREPPEASH